MDKFRLTAGRVGALIRDPDLRQAWAEHVDAEIALLNALAQTQTEQGHGMHQLRRDVTVAIDTQIRDIVSGLELRMDIAAQERREILDRLARIVSALEPAPDSPDTSTPTP